MPPKRTNWGDIPQLAHVKDKDPQGKWIECSLCELRIKVRAPYGMTEWVNHCDSTKHINRTNAPPKKEVIDPEGPNKRPKINLPCPGFGYGKNQELLALYNIYKKEDSLNDAITIRCLEGRWTAHSIDCTNLAVFDRKSQRPDKLACEACFTFPKAQVIKDRVKRMEKIMRVEQHLMEANASESAYHEVSNFMKRNVNSASDTTKLLMKRCQKYLEHHQWIKRNLTQKKIEQKNAVKKETTTTEEQKHSVSLSPQPELKSESQGDQMTPNQTQEKAAAAASIREEMEVFKNKMKEDQLEFKENLRLQLMFNPQQQK